MKRTRLVLLFTLLILLLAVPVLADDPDGDVVIWGDNYTLESGQQVRGDVLVYGGNVTLQTDSRVGGNVTVFGGNVTIAGNVDGDVTTWGGNVRIKSSATVRGQVMSVGGQVNREEGADVRGGEIEGLPFGVPQPPKLPKQPQMPVRPQAPRVNGYSDWGHEMIRRISNLFRSVFGMLLMVVLGILVVVFIPRHTEVVAETMAKAPMQSLGIGIASLLGGAIILLILSAISAVLIVTICLAPIGLLLLLPLLVAGVAILFGWIAAGLLLGVKVLRAIIHKEPNQVAAVAIGIGTLSLLSLVPCIGWALTIIAITWSLGAVVYSLFGTRTLASATPQAGGGPAAAPAPAPDAEDYDPRMDRL
jgi:hypothetical protein